MDILTYDKIVSGLDACFDDPTTRQKTLDQRTPITERLEKMLLELIVRINPDGFIEVGAYEAAFSLEMKKKFPRASIVAVEANPRVFQHFSDKVNKQDVTYLNLAVDEETAEIDFFIPEVIAGNKMPFAGRMGSTREVGLRESESSKVTVSAKTLDSIAEDIRGEKLCLWVDVEGAAEKALRGGEETLKRTAIVYVEMESSPVWKNQVLAPDVVRMLQDRGFVAVARDCQKWFQKNVIFLHRDYIGCDELAHLVQAYSDWAKSFYQQEDPF